MPSSFDSSDSAPSAFAAPGRPVGQRPRIAVIMPVYNAQTDFQATMESLSRSTESCDIVAVDDGSSPPLDVSGYRVHLIRLPYNRGAIPAANLGLEYILQQGYEYIARTDTGDLSHKHRLARQVAFLDQQPACMLVGCDTDLYIGADYQFTLSPPRDQADLASGLREHSWLLHSTLMFRASVLAELGLYSEEFEAAEDHEICLRIAGKYPIGVVPERLVSTVYRTTGISFSKRRTQLVSRLRIQLRYFCWRSPRSYFGLFKCLVSLSLPASIVRWLKRNLIYSRFGIQAVTV